MVINTIINIAKKTLKIISSIKPEIYIFGVTVIFYLLLWLINPVNKIIALGYIFLIVLYFFRLKEIKTSLLFAYLASTIIFTGKTYPIQLLPFGVLPEEIFPQGYFINLIVSSSHILSFAMLIILIRYIFTEQKVKLYAKFKTVDLLIISFFFWKIISSITYSKMPDLSLIIEILTLPNLVLYFYLRFIVKIDKNFWLILAFLFSSMIIFQSFVSVLQFIAKSPIYKSVEVQTNIEYFGKTIDETEFTFRPVGTFNHANVLGIWLSSILTFLTVFVLNKSKTILYLAYLLGFITLIITLSRSSWLGFFIGFIFLFNILRKVTFVKNIINKYISKKIILFIPILILLTIFFILPRIEKTFYSFGLNEGGGYFRKIQNEDTFEIIKTNPIFGIGNGMAVYEGISLDLHTIAASLPLEVHNWYLQLCLISGIPSLILFFLPILLTIRSVLYKHKKQIINPVYYGLIASIISLFIAGLFQPYLNENFIFLSLGALNSDTI